MEMLNILKYFLLFISINETINLHKNPVLRFVCFMFSLHKSARFIGLFRTKGQNGVQWLGKLLSNDGVFVQPH